MAEHTKTPWEAKPAKADGSCFKADVIARSERSGLDVMPAQAAGYTVEEAEANAQLIVRACNSHDALLEALEEIHKICGRPGDDDQLLMEADDVACTAIAAVKEKRKEVE